MFAIFLHKLSAILQRGWLTGPHNNSASIFDSLAFITSVWLVVVRERYGLKRNNKGKNAVFLDKNISSKVRKTLNPMGNFFLKRPNR